MQHLSAILAQNMQIDYTVSFKVFESGCAVCCYRFRNPETVWQKDFFSFQVAAEDLTALLTDGNMRLRPISHLTAPLIPSII